MMDRQQAETWEVDLSAFNRHMGDPRVIIRGRPEEPAVAVVQVIESYRPREATLANVRLIAAAPELLAALRAMVNSTGHTLDCREDQLGITTVCTQNCQRVRAALRLVEGG